MARGYRAAVYDSTERIHYVETCSAQRSVHGDIYQQQKTGGGDAQALARQGEGSQDLISKRLNLQQRCSLMPRAASRRADAVVSVMTKDGRRVVFLIEHKSTQSRDVFKTAALVSDYSLHGGG